MVKFCPACGAGVESGAASCESCGADLAALSAQLTKEPVPPAAPAALLTVADLTPRQLRKEIRWGVFQGVLLIGVIVLLVYAAIFLFIALAVGSATVIGG